MTGGVYCRAFYVVRLDGGILCEFFWGRARDSVPQPKQGCPTIDKIGRLSRFALFGRDPVFRERFQYGW